MKDSMVVSIHASRQDPGGTDETVLASLVLARRGARKAALRAEISVGKVSGSSTTAM